MAKNNTTFDNVFRTMLEKMPELIVPVLNEIFGTNYPLDVPLEQLRNEHQTLNGEKITDSYFRIGKKGYHFECQSTGDSKMVIRMVEYDFAISIENVKKENGIFRMRFPHSAVIYLRGTRKKRLRMELIMPDGKIVRYQVPVLCVQKYTKDEIFQKKLLFLLPFYIMRYEKDKKKINKSETELHKLLEEYESILHIGTTVFHSYKLARKKFNEPINYVTSFYLIYFLMFGIVENAAINIEPLFMLFLLITAQ